MYIFDFFDLLSKVFGLKRYPASDDNCASLTFIASSSRAKKVDWWFWLLNGLLDLKYSLIRKSYQNKDKTLMIQIEASMGSIWPFQINLHKYLLCSRDRTVPNICKCPSCLNWSPFPCLTAIRYTFKSKFV